MGELKNGIRIVNLIKPDWMVFAAKFSDNQEWNFEWLCYLLVCREYNRPFGLFRFRDQAAVETDPIHTQEGECVVWQAKYYNSSLTNKKSEILKCLDKINKYYENVDRLIFFTNLEWSQAKGKSPKAKSEIEAKARGFGFEIEWRCRSYFDSPFVCDENYTISQHFFSYEMSNVELIRKKEEISIKVFGGVERSIDFNGNALVFDRAKLLKEIESQKDQVLVVAGEGGVGKTVEIANLYDSIGGEIPFYIFRGREFLIGDIDELFPHVGAVAFMKAHRSGDRGIVVIDSAERLAEVDDLEPFELFLKLVVEEGWRVVLTTRAHYLEDLGFILHSNLGIVPAILYIDRIGIEELREASERFSFELPSDEKLLELVRIPFYLREYLAYHDDCSLLDFPSFKSTLWKKVIRKSSQRREQAFLSIARKRALQGSFYLNEGEIEAGMLEAFASDGILGVTANGYYIAHDIYEEWALEKLIDGAYASKDSIESFFETIGRTLPVRRSFRMWLSDRLLLSDPDVLSLVNEIWRGADLDSTWMDESIVSVLLSPHAKFFLEGFKNELLSDGYALLKKLLVILRVACKQVDRRLSFSVIGTDASDDAFDYLLTVPKGGGWEAIIQFLNNEFSILPKDLLVFCVPVLHDWSRSNNVNSAKRWCGLLALRTYKHSESEERYYLSGKLERMVVETVFACSSHISSELGVLIALISDEGYSSNHDPYHEFRKAIPRDISAYPFVREFPTETMQLCEREWLDREGERDGFSRYDLSTDFGLRNLTMDYYPSSAFQTPIGYLLMVSFEEALDFSLEVVDYCYDSYSKSELGIGEARETAVRMPDGSLKNYRISERLWSMYRGISSGPHVLESIHMALESYFLRSGETLDSEVLTASLLRLIERSNSASILGLVSSIVAAFPKKTFKVAEVLFSSKELFYYDMVRCRRESGSFSAGYGEVQMMHARERRRSSSLKHRSFDLEAILFQSLLYRDFGGPESEFEIRAASIFKQLDVFYGELPDFDEQVDDQKSWSICLGRMDTRKMKTRIVDQGDKRYYSFQPGLDPRVQAHSEDSIKDVNERMKFAPLSQWAQERFNRKRVSGGLAYETDPLKALSDVKEYLEELWSGKSESVTALRIYRSLPAYVFSVFLRDFPELMKEDDLKLCRDVIFEFSELQFSSGYFPQMSDGVIAASLSLPYLYSKCPDDREKISGLVLRSILSLDGVGVAGFNDEDFGSALVSGFAEVDASLHENLICAYLLLKGSYLQFCRELRFKNFRAKRTGADEEDPFEVFCDVERESFDKFVLRGFEFSDIVGLDSIDLEVIEKAFCMIPYDFYLEEGVMLLEGLSIAYISKSLSSRSSLNTYSTYRFSRHFSKVVLGREDPIGRWFAFEVQSGSNLEIFSTILNALILVCDSEGWVDRFWSVWRLLRPLVLKIAESGGVWRYSEDVVKEYLFYGLIRVPDEIKWKGFNNYTPVFFSEMSKSLGHCSFALEAIVKFLDGVGRCYLSEGLDWVHASVCRQVGESRRGSAETVFYMERFVRRYLFENRTLVKKSKSKKDRFVEVLDFLASKKSVVGYLVRESIA